MLHLQKPEETSSRFFRVSVWLAFVFVVGFPNEHWYEEKIKDCFRGFAEVAEIDLECLTGDNFGPLRLLLEVNDRLEILRELRISCKLGVGRSSAVATVLPCRVWPCEYQLDNRGNLARFFGPPAPPAPGPSLGPMGPMSSQQQLRPQPHYYNLAYPKCHSKVCEQPATRVRPSRLPGPVGPGHLSLAMCKVHGLCSHHGTDAQPAARRRASGAGGWVSGLACAFARAGQAADHLSASPPAF
jgi:hypothetical protein